MLFNSHSEIQEGAHAEFSASKYAWVNYDIEKFDRVYYSLLKKRRGSQEHAYAHQAIKLRIKQARSPKTLNMYINDAIGFRMLSEQPLVYNDRFFGTPDAISFKDNFLRIHDLKTGEIPASMKQLEIYAALFCLEYGYKPFEIGIELRIYQNDEVLIYEADPGEILRIMDQMRLFSARIVELEAAW